MISSKTSHSQGESTGKTRVLIVDDIRDAATSLDVLMRIAGHETRLAFDGVSALAAYQEFRPHVVLLDLGLPGLDGLHVCERIRAMPESAAVRIIIISGRTADNKNESIRAGANFHMLKPVEPLKLMELVAMKS